MKKFWMELMPALDPGASTDSIRANSARRSTAWLRSSRSTRSLCIWPFRSARATSTTRKPYRIGLSGSRWNGYAKKGIVSRATGELSSFLQMFMLQAVNAEAQPFKEHMLQRGSGFPSRLDAAVCDLRPVAHESGAADQGEVEEAIGTARWWYRAGARKYWCMSLPDRFGSLPDFLTDIFNANERHAPVKIGVEKNSLDDWILQPLRMEMMRNGVSLPLVPLSAPQDRSKEQFIMGLQPFAMAGDVVLVGGKLAHAQLVAEWCNFPQGSRDIINALAYALRMFSGIPVYEDFSGANIGEAPSPRNGESVFIGFNTTPSEVVAVAVVRDGGGSARGGDWAASGPTSDAVKTLAFEIRSTFPRAQLQSWVPADTFDQWQRNRPRPRPSGRAAHTVSSGARCDRARLPIRSPAHGLARTPHARRRRRRQAHSERAFSRLRAAGRKRGAPGERTRGRHLAADRGGAGMHGGDAGQDRRPTGGLPEGREHRPHAERPGIRFI